MQPKQNNAQIKSVHQIKDTLFSAIEHNGKFHITLGNNIVSEKKFNSFNQAVDYVNSKPWELILSLNCFIVEKFNSYQNEQKQLKEFAQKTQENN